MATIDDLIRRSHSRLFRRAYIKRRNQSDGLYENNWTEITSDVKNWGTIKTTVDITQYNKFKFSGFRLKVANSQGRFGPESVESSLWHGFSSPQRSLVKVEVGYLDQSLGADGVWTNTELPQESGTIASAYVGVLIGDMNTNDRNDMSIPIQPLTEVFRHYPAEALSGYTTTGLTAQKFIENVRDHIDANGVKIFLPFFGNTNSGFNIASTTVIYSDLNTSGSESVAGKNVWGIIERLAQAETFVPYVTKDGVFNFAERDTNQSIATYDFFGAGFFDRTTGHNIKRISRFGLKYTKFYSRVRVQFQEPDTITSFRVVESSLTVASNSLPWLYGHKTIDIENVWIPNSTTAAEIAQAVFNNVSELRDEIAFTAPLIPQLDIFDRISVSYDTNPTDPDSVWDANDWAVSLVSTLASASDINDTAAAAAFAIGDAYRHAHTFTVAAGFQYLQSVKIPIGVTVNNTNAAVWIELYDSSASAPSSLLSTSDSVLTNDMPANTASSETTFNFPSTDELTVGGTYHWLINYNDIGPTNRYKITQSTNTLTGTWAQQSSNSGTSWVNFSQVFVNEVVMGDGPKVDPDDDSLIWDKNIGDAINLNGAEFALLSIENNLDKLETKITARKT